MVGGAWRPQPRERMTRKAAENRMVHRCLAAGAVQFFIAMGSLSFAAELPPEFSRLADVAPGVAQDMRYAGPNNFTGKPVPGYRAAQCWLRTEAARALAKVQEDSHAHGFDLVVYDCYRPKSAVAAFIDWSRNAINRPSANIIRTLQSARFSPRAISRRTRRTRRDSPSISA
jgi:D-alanyl-D-alanine dipeptidase